MGLFYKKPYDYTLLASKWIPLITQSGSTEKLHHNLLQFMMETVSASSAALILKEDHRFVVRTCLGGLHFTFSENHCSAFLQTLSEYRMTLTRNQMLRDLKFSSIKKEAFNFFVQFQAEACVPIFNEEQLFGCIALSSKKDGRPYVEACLNVLDWLASQYSLALQNAHHIEMLKKQTTMLQEIQELKTQITAHLSHELRTPLTSIIGFAELLLEEIDGPLKQEQKRHLFQIVQSGNRLLKTLSTFMDLAKLEAGQFSLSVKQFHLMPLVHDVKTEIAFPETVEFEAALDSHTPMIYGDVSFIRQVLKNLLDNAAKYTPKGKIGVSAKKKGEMLEICIADTGIGIAPEKISKILNGFYQVDGGLTREYQGAGLGLSVARKFVEAHGGRLWVKSSLGFGSKFYFTLPLKPIGIKHRELAA